MQPTPNKANEIAEKHAQDALKKKQLEQTSRLVKAVLELEKRFKREEQDAKKNGGKFTWGGFAKNSAKQGVARLRDVASLRGIGGMMGLRQDSFLGSMLEARHQSKIETREEKLEKAKDAREHAKKWGELTDRGRQMKKNGFSQERIIAEGVKDYEKRLKIAERIKQIEEKIADAKKLGNADISAKEKKELEQLQTEQANLGKAVTRKKKEPVQEEPVVKPAKEKTRKITKTEADEITEALLSIDDTAKNTIATTQEHMGRDLTEEEQKELIQGLKSGMSEEILQLNKEQLEELRLLVKNTKESQEDKFEKGKVKNTIEHPEETPKEKKKESIMDKFDSIKDKFSGLTDMLGKGKNLLGKAGPLLKGAGAIGGALAVGNGISDLMDGKRQEEMPTGMDVLDPMKWGMFGGEKINKGVESLTGDSVGGNIYNGINKAKSFFGIKTNDDKIAEMLKGTESRAKTVDSLESKRIAREAQTGAKNTPAPVINTSNVVNNNTKINKVSVPVRNIEPSFNARLQSVMV